MLPAHAQGPRAANRRQRLAVTGRMCRRGFVASALAAGMMLGLASGAQAAPMDVTFTVVNQRGINQFSFIKLAGSSGFSKSTDGNGQFSAGGFSCLYQGGACVSPGDHVYFSRDQGAPGGCAAPEDPGGLDYVVTSSPSQTVTLANSTGDSNHTSLTNTESWIVGKLNQDRAAHNPPLPALHVSSTLTRAAYAIAHDRALAAGHPYPPPHCYVNLSDWGWPAPGFLHEDSPYAAPEKTLAHWDGTAGDPESVNLAKHGVFNAQNTAVGVADGGGTWIIEYNDCSAVAPAFVGRCGMTSDTGDPNAYTPPPPGGDTSAPAITITSPAGGARYVEHQVVNASYSCTDPDGAADVVTCAGPVASGGAIDTSTVGRHAFKVNASDQAGNKSARTVNYTVALGGRVPHHVRTTGNWCAVCWYGH